MRHSSAHAPACMKGEYGCRNGRCIAAFFLCDGLKDCPGGDDEMEPHCGERGGLKGGGLRGGGLKGGGLKRGGLRGGGLKGEV